MKALHGFNNSDLVTDEQFVISAYQASQKSRVWSYRSAYNELIRTGNINLIKNDKLKSLILGYYADDLANENILLNEIYLEYIRGVIPFEIQDMIRSKCGDIPNSESDDYGSLLPENCDLQLPDELFSESAAYLRSQTDMLKNLQYQLAVYERFIYGMKLVDKGNQKLMAAIKEYKP